MSIINENINPEIKETSTKWELSRASCKKDLIIKKVAIVTIGLLNLALLGVALYMVIAHCSIPAQVLLVSPFIVGVLSVVSAFQRQRRANQTTTQDYSSFGDPLEAMGMFAGYLIFGPLKYTMNHLDMTPYHDPYRADKIFMDFKQKTFKELSLQYGQHFDNLYKYGFLREIGVFRAIGIPDEKILKQMHNEQQNINFSLTIWPAENNESNIKEKGIEDLWLLIKDVLILPVSTPPPVDTSRRAQFFHRVSQLFSFENAPVQSSASQAAAS